MIYVGDMRYTSLVGYEHSVISGLKSKLHRDIMQCLFEADVPMTRRMIEVRMGIRISSVTGAVWTLMQLPRPLIVCSHEAKDPLSGQLAQFLLPAWPPGRLKLETITPHGVHLEPRGTAETNPFEVPE